MAEEILSPAQVEVVGPMSIRDSSGNIFQYAGLDLPSWIHLEPTDFKRFTDLHRALIGKNPVRIKPIKIRGQSKNYSHQPAIVFLDTKVLNLQVVSHGLAGARKDGYYALKSFSKSLVDAQIEAAESKLGIWSGKYGQYPFVKSRKSEILHYPYCPIRYKISKQNYTEIYPPVDLKESSLVPCKICMAVELNEDGPLDLISIAGKFAGIPVILAAVFFWAYLHSRPIPEGKQPKNRRRRKTHAFELDAGEYVALLNSRLRSFYALREMEFIADESVPDSLKLTKEFMDKLHLLLVGLSKQQYEGSIVSLKFHTTETEATARIVVSNLQEPPVGFDKLQESCHSLRLSPTMELSFVPDKHQTDV
ncbi:MAG: hypothetical protein QGG53_34010 [Planctomycetota bacterium]|nr:hypothetical protein [Planctomycetota bacterium]